MGNIKKSTRKEITKAEYLQLLGLRTLSDGYREILNGAVKSAQKITGEIDYDGLPELMGHTSDMVFGMRELDEMLRLLDLKVVEEE
jgi:hypothetical protein